MKIAYFVVQFEPKIKGLATQPENVEDLENRFQKIIEVSPEISGFENRGFVDTFRIFQE